MRRLYKKNFQKRPDSPQTYGKTHYMQAKRDPLNVNGRHSIISDGVHYSQAEVLEIYQAAYQKGLADGRREQKEQDLQRQEDSNLFTLKPRIF